MDLEQGVPQKVANSFLIYRVYGKILIVLGTITAFVGSLWGFPFVVTWGLIYIFGSRIPRYGWSGPNNTAVDMLTGVFWFVLGVVLFSILLGYVFEKISKKSKLTVTALVFSIIAHILVIFSTVVVLTSGGHDDIGGAIVLGLGVIGYLVLGVFSWILLITNRST